MKTPDEVRDEWAEWAAGALAELRPAFSFLEAWRAEIVRDWPQAVKPMADFVAGIGH